LVTKIAPMTAAHKAVITASDAAMLISAVKIMKMLDPSANSSRTPNNH
jgi:hypothetical protein